MDKDLPSSPQKSTDDVKLNVIVADTRWETFEQISGFGKEINFLNLSSNFAVDFILEYEKIDVILISRRIAGLDGITKKAQKKKASVYILGEDVKYPLDVGQISQLLENERILRLEKLNAKKRAGPGSYIRRMFGLSGERRLLKHARKAYKAKKTKKPLTLNKPEKVNNDEKLPVEEVIKNNNENPDNYDELFWGEKKNEKEQDYGSGILRAPANSEVKTLQNFIAIKQKIIVFLKAKGGVGSTLLSLFLAYHFRKLKTLLVDLNFCEGGSDIGYYLNIPKTPNMIVFIEGYNRNAMENSVINIKENLDVLQAPPTYELSKKMDLQDIYSMVDIARKKYHLIIFDLPNQINDLCLGVLDMADLAVMVSDFTVGSIGRLISINKRYIYNDLEKLLVLNRQRNGNGSYFINNYVGEFFNLKEVVMLDENELLNRKTDFNGFDFSRVKEFSGLTDRIMERLTCE